MERKVRRHFELCTALKKTFLLKHWFYDINYMLCRCGGMADAHDSKSCGKPCGFESRHRHWLIIYLSKPRINKQDFSLQRKTPWVAVMLLMVFLLRNIISIISSLRNTSALFSFIRCCAFLRYSSFLLRHIYSIIPLPSCRTLRSRRYR